MFARPSHAVMRSLFPTGCRCRPLEAAPHGARRAAMALAALSGDEQCIIFSQLCNPLDPGVAVAFGSISSELWALTPALLQQLRADYEVATALCRKVGLRSCKELREAKKVEEINQSISAAELALLGTLGSVLPALEELRLYKLGSWEAGHGWQAGKLAEKLGAGALPAVRSLQIAGTVCMWATQAPRHSPPPWAEAP